MTSSNFPPQGYIIGAQKAATTSLAALLQQHEGITVSDPKEPDFFTNNWGKGLDWYRSCFARDDTLLIDASTSYTMAQVTNTKVAVGSSARRIDVPKRIHKARPDAKFIYVVREPASRTFSGYWHDVRAGRERRSLREVIEQSPGYLDTSFYYAQIARYLEYFDISHFLFVRFEEFTRDPLANARRCAEFLGVGAFAFRPEPVRNESFQYNTLGTFVRQRFGTDRLQSLSTLLRKMAPEWLHNRAKRVVSAPIPRMSDEERAWLLSFFEKDIEAFEKLTGLALWPAKNARPANVRESALAPQSAEHGGAAPTMISDDLAERARQR